MRRRFLLGLAGMTMGLLLTSGQVHSQGPGDYPNKPVRMIVPFAPGGASDFLARAIAPRLSQVLGQQIVIELSLQATGLLFEVGGASAVGDRYGFDRHWRNARTLASHNPAILREPVIGAYRLKGVSPRA